MRSEKNSSYQQLGPHSIHTRAGDRHWQDENAWLIAEERTPEGGLSLVKRG